MNIAVRRDGFLPRPARLLLATGPVALAGALGSLATLPNIPAWYSGLAKPPWTPPNGAFGPAWTVLYGLMAVSIFRLLSAAESGARRKAVVLFFVQLALNGLWSWSFFAAHSPAAGLVNILLLDMAIMFATAAAARIDRLAGACLVPYLAWVLFATYLNAGIWWLNR